jgi:hypothetical protein
MLAAFAEPLNELKDIHAADGGEAGIDDGKVDGVPFDELHSLGAAVGFEGANAERYEKAGDGLMPGLNERRAGDGFGSRGRRKEEVEPGIWAHGFHRPGICKPHTREYQ